jgi:hypothetical protein
VHEESQESEISMLTMEGVENYSYSRKNHHHSSITTMIMSANSSLPTASTTTASTESSSTISATTTLPYGGRPKGTTAVASSIMAEKVKECNWSRRDASRCTSHKQRETYSPRRLCL